jgi:hypothetical protein
MAHARFHSPFQWHPKPTLSVVFPAGFEGVITRDQCDQAVAAGCAVEITDFSRGDDAPAPAEPSEEIST